MKLLTTILFLTSLNAFSGVVPEGITTRSAKVNVACRGDNEAVTQTYYEHLKKNFNLEEAYKRMANTEIAFWGEGKVRVKITIENVLGHDFSFSYVGVDNGFGEYVLYESPGDIAKNNPADISMQIYPTSVNFELKKYKLLNRTRIVKEREYRSTGYVLDTFFYCILPGGVNMSFPISLKGNGWF